MAEAALDIDAAVEEAAFVALAGIDPMRFVDCADPDERRLMLAVARRHAELVNLRDENLAIRIANQVGGLFRG